MYSYLIMLYKKLWSIDYVEGCLEIKFKGSPLFDGEILMRLSQSEIPYEIFEISCFLHNILILAWKLCQKTRTGGKSIILAC